MAKKGKQKAKQRKSMAPAAAATASIPPSPEAADEAENANEASGEVAKIAELAAPASAKVEPAETPAQGVEEAPETEPEAKSEPEAKTSEPPKSEPPKRISERPTAERDSLTESGEHPAVAAAFFERDPHHGHGHDDFEDLVPESDEHHAHQHRARRATMILLALGLFLVGGYFLYTRFGTVQPVEVGGHGITLPERIAPH